MESFPITLRCSTCKLVCWGGGWQSERRTRFVRYADWVCHACRAGSQGSRKGPGGLAEPKGCDHPPRSAR